MFYAIYKDDGPCGCCGTAGSMIGKGVKKLYIFKDVRHYRTASEKLYKIRGRRNARFEDLFSDSGELEGFANLVMFVEGEE